MDNVIHKETVSNLLWNALNILMDNDELKDFRLVGGTSLSLMIGHRVSIDIDMFTDSDYRTINFQKVYKSLNNSFPFVSNENWINETIGNSCFVGNSKTEVVKLDLFYTDQYVYPTVMYKNIRLSRLEEITAMKLDVIGRGGRKKDFWDIHALFEYFTVNEMLDFYEKRYPHNFSRKVLLKQLINFENANHDPDPNCLFGKYWELIKLDIEDIILEQSY